jgi:hypothetical protein
MLTSQTGWADIDRYTSPPGGPTIKDFEEKKEQTPGSSSRPTATDFLKTFSSTLAESLANRDRNAAQKGLSEVVKSAYGASSSKGGLNDDLTIVNPGAPTIIPRTQGSGLGGVLGSALGAGLGLAVPGLGPVLGAQLGGGIGGLF